MLTFVLHQVVTMLQTTLIGAAGYFVCTCIQYSLVMFVYRRVEGIRVRDNRVRDNRVRDNKVRDNGTPPRRKKLRSVEKCNNYINY